MGVSPESGRERPVDFRAPPPSPVASGRRSCVTNDDVLTEFLESSLRVPDLILPDKIFPKQKFIEDPSRIDFGSLGAPGSDAVSRALDSVARVGCFQLVNHGIGRKFSLGAMEAAAGIFLVPPEKRAAAMRSPEKPYGFEEVHSGGEEEESSELAEEFVWCREEGLESEMQRMWPVGYSNFSDKMAKLQSHVEKIAERVMTVLWEKCLDEPTRENGCMNGEGHAGAGTGTMCCLLKHSKNVLDDDRWASSLRYDVIRMLIRGADYSHALCLHVCDGASEFHVYSKKGWVSFCPDKRSLIVTVGDQFQALSGGRYKHVVGRPIVKSETEDRISMAFLCSPPPSVPGSKDGERGGRNTVSVGQQVMVAIALSLAYHLFVYVLSKF
ncbi:flavanone 3-dioxygenase 2 [Rhodamnia argentea]|uniref:Flavanone 3-dioxygenase 2 n=1 Tax=Rhodamnia argentea TaxID=178133 RepID=A0A8B8NST6_9MYRT|nr:flavanone 3-dioxygenase 2 [Rhodamnia argentea]